MGALLHSAHLTIRYALANLLLPFPEDRKPGQPLPSIKGERELSDEAIAYAREVWDGMGYEGE